MLVAEGFQVNVAMLPAGDDPDNFIRKHGGAAYQEKLRNSRPYLEYLLDRAAAGRDFTKDDVRREFLGEMLTVAARIPDAAARDQFADRLAHRAKITEEVVRAEIRKAAVLRQTTVEDRAVPPVGQVKAAERGLIWALMHDPEAALSALADLEDVDLEGLASRGILAEARSLQDWPAPSLPKTLLERLSQGEAGLIEDISRHRSAPAGAADCVRTLKKLRFDRERAAVQREIDRLQEQGPDRHEQIDALWARKKDLLQRIEALMGAEGR
jgi:DNA primase